MEIENNDVTIFHLRARDEREFLFFNPPEGIFSFEESEGRGMWIGIDHG